MTTPGGRRQNDAQNGRVIASMTALIVDDETSYRTYLAALAEREGSR